MSPVVAHRVIHGAAAFLVAIGCIADIDRPQVLGRSVANDPKRTSTDRGWLREKRRCLGLMLLPKYNLCRKLALVSGLFGEMMRPALDNGLAVARMLMYCPMRAFRIILPRGYSDAS